MRSERFWATQTTYIYVYMLRIAGQMAGPIGPTFFVDIHEW